MLVFSMALLLIGGVLLLSSVVWQKASGTACSGGEVDIRAYGQIVDMFQGREGIQVVTKDGDKLVIFTLDACSGKLLATTTVKTQN